MTPPRNDSGAVRMSDAEFELLLARAADEDARRALTEAGLGGEDAEFTIHDLRSLPVWMPPGLQGRFGSLSI